MRRLKFFIVLLFSATRAYSADNVLIVGKFTSSPFEDIPLTAVGLNYNKKEIPEIRSKVDKKGKFRFSFSIAEAGFYKLGDGFMGHIMFIEPGDTVLITLTPYPQKEIQSGKPFHRTFNMMSVKSKKQMHYLFFDKLFEKTKLFGKFIPGKGTALQFKNKCDTAYAISNKLLNKYIADKMVSDTFAYYAKAEIDSKYILDLCDCLYWIPKNKLPANFFNNIPIKDFNDQNLADKTDSYITAVSVYNVYIANDFDTHVQGYTDLELKDEFGWAFKNLTGVIRDRIMSWIIDDNKDKGFSSYDSVYNVFVLNCKTEKLKNWAISKVETYKQTKKTQLQSFDEVLAKTKVINTQGDTLSFSSILNSKTNSIIDFWATWCKPCLEAKPGFEKASEKYKSKLTFISLSADDNFEKWKKFPKKSKSINDYLLVDNFKSPLALYLDLTGIPRFVSISKKEVKVVDRNMVRPQFADEFNQVLDSYALK